MSIKSDLLEYAVKHAGEALLKNDLATALKLEDQQVTSGMYQLIKDGTHGVTVVVDGRVWKLDKKPVTGVIFEQVGITKKGLPILQDEDGDIYLAHKIEG